MSSFALLLLATPVPATAEEVIAAHRARTSVIQERSAEGCREDGPRSDDDVLVCGRRETERYRVEATVPEPDTRPGIGGLASVRSGQATFGTCGVGANTCEKPVVDFMKVADVLIRGIMALTDGE